MILMGGGVPTPVNPLSMSKHHFAFYMPQKKRRNCDAEVKETKVDILMKK